MCGGRVVGSPRFAPLETPALHRVGVCFSPTPQRCTSRFLLALARHFVARVISGREFVARGRGTNDAAALTRYTERNMAKTMCCMGRNPTCFSMDPALQWWRSKNEKHTGGYTPCPCAEGGYCDSVASFHRWLENRGVGVSLRSMKGSYPSSVRGFTWWTADAVACAAGVHPSMWWPEWFNYE